MYLKHLRSAATLIVLVTIMTGFLYPFVVTELAQLIFPAKANGSMIVKNGKILGSELIGQEFTSPKYFWGRLSATAPKPYNGGASTGSNYGPLNPAMHEAVKQRLRILQSADSLNRQKVPIDLVTASSSGLDPHISIAAALYQIPRVARNRSISEEQLRHIVEKYTEERTFGFFGESRVNVLCINIALDELHPSPEKK